MWNLLWQEPFHSLGTAGEKVLWVRPASLVVGDWSGSRFSPEDLSVRGGLYGRRPIPQVAWTQKPCRAFKVISNTLYFGRKLIGSQ